MTEPTIEIARLLLAAVFAVAGVAKLADREGSRAALSEFGVPTRLARPLVYLLSTVELAIAAALVPAASARPAAVAAAALLGAFAAAIALVRGRKPDCHCFGRLHSAPAGAGTPARYLALGGVGAVFASQPSSSPSATHLVGTVIALGVAGQALLSWRPAVAKRQKRRTRCV